MIADLCIWPIGRETHTSPVLAMVVGIVKSSGLPYQLTPTSTCIEGTMTDIWEVVRTCHDAVRAECTHFVLSVRFEEDGGETGKIAANVASVEKEAGEDLATAPSETPASPQPRVLSPAVGTYVVTGRTTANPS